ncbi:hypothetical protein FB45DRAFT_1028782 [Roridomyces roridus]|uniref:RING-type domain-containing protein n=1 Tax=Roridomyces roridus TaxID=1738132 RepID=A0AAD7BRV7_9AGAR|nr:hypothetical protein FB45DRAFT_1028782 [Roridomyces roridus]
MFTPSITSDPESFGASVAFVSGVICSQMLEFYLIYRGGRLRWIILRQYILLLAAFLLLLVLPVIIPSLPLDSFVYAVDLVWICLTVTELLLLLSPVLLQLHQRMQDIEERVGDNAVKAVLSRVSSSPEQFPLRNLETLEKTRIAHLLVPDLSIDESHGVQPRAFLRQPEDRIQLLREKARDHLKCCICFGFLCQPYILGCGHVFDISCLIHWLTDPKLLKEDPYDIFVVDLSKGCPICRAPLETSPISLFFLDGLQELFADAEDAVDRSRLQPRLRFVPLDTVYPEIARQRTLAGRQAIHYILRDGEPLDADEPLQQDPHPEAPPQHLLLPARPEPAAPQFDEEEPGRPAEP